ncbi:hypothetical protein, partial [Collimonas fungivorans]|uniref:hypothetical protein n=1 Tax=Collimonas fungivorans TaxID=158899 RepID=UPI003FA3AE5C
MASISGGAAGGVAGAAMDGRPKKRQSSRVLRNLARMGETLGDNACMGADCQARKRYRKTMLPGEALRKRDLLFNLFASLFISLFISLNARNSIPR